MDGANYLLPTSNEFADHDLSQRPMSRPRASPLSLGITVAAGADAQVYKCTQPNGTVLYTDRTCKGGTAVDIRLGPTDPAAPARLAHAQAELNAVAAQRRADEEIAAARRQDLNRLQLEAEAEQEPTAPLADYPDVPYGPMYRPYKGHAHRRGSPSKQLQDTLAPRVDLSPSEHTFMGRGERVGNP